MSGSGECGLRGASSSEMLQWAVRRVRGERRRSVEGGLQCVRGEQQRTVGGLTSAREGRTAAKCWRVDFGAWGEKSSEVLKGGLRRVGGEERRSVEEGMTVEGGGRGEEGGGAIWGREGGEARSS